MEVLTAGAWRWTWASWDCRPRRPDWNLNVRSVCSGGWWPIRLCFWPRRPPVPWCRRSRIHGRPAQCPDAGLKDSSGSGCGDCCRNRRIRPDGRRPFRWSCHCMDVFYSSLSDIIFSYFLCSFCTSLRGTVSVKYIFFCIKKRFPYIFSVRPYTFGWGVNIAVALPPSNLSRFCFLFRIMDKSFGGQKPFLPR